jgi:tetratricopeptide (TPR) repeat protein
MSVQPEAYFAAALEQLQRGLTQAALELCQAGLGYQAQNHEGWHLLALILRQKQDLNAACQAIEKAVNLAPEQASLYTTWGNLLSENGQNELAERAYLLALNCEPDYLPAWLNAAKLAEECGLFERALLAYESALALSSDNQVALLGKAELLRRAGRWQEADTVYQRSLKNPRLSLAECARLWTQWGVLKQDQGLLFQALEAQQRALVLDPNLADAWFNQGSIWHEQGDFLKASQSYQEALRLNPELAEAHLNQALLDLAEQKWEKGFSGLAWRRNCLDWQGRKLEKPWQGQSLLGKTIWVQGEYGQGDIILFARFLPFLVERGARILLSGPPGLASLLTTLPGLVFLGPEGKPLPDQHWDWAIPLLDLPWILGLNPRDTDFPYLFPEPQDAGVRCSLNTLPKEGLKIGFCWHGQKPELHPLPTAQRMAAHKILPLAAFADLAQTFSEHQFLSLQWPPEPDVLDAFPVLIDRARAIEHWLDTALLIQALDLVISADTAVAHLAGALGKPVWVLLPTPVYWFWPASGEDFAWYPSMRLFRQAVPGDWRTTFEKIKEALRKTDF